MPYFFLVQENVSEVRDGAHMDDPMCDMIDNMCTFLPPHMSAIVWVVF